MTQRLALIIACNEYNDEKIPPLKACANDAIELEKLLKNPAIGYFNDVILLINEEWINVRDKIIEFFHNKTSEDLLLLYFAGHAYKDNNSKLYFAVKDTKRDNLKSRGLSASEIKQCMIGCRAKKQVLILDCCYSGAFSDGIRGEIQEAPQELAHNFDFTSAGEGGKGKYVLTSSNPFQLSYESAGHGIFTHALLEGLKGEAVRCDTEEISMDDLNSYVCKFVAKEQRGSQTPTRSCNTEGSPIIIAKNPKFTIQKAVIEQPKGIPYDGSHCGSWSFSDSCYDYSKRTYEYMLNTRYFPSCYEVPSDLDKHFESFLKSGEEYIDKEKDSKSPKHFVSGFILVGSAGTGKSAFLTYETGNLINFHKEYITFFLRGEGILARTGSGNTNILFKNIIEKIGIKAEKFSSFSELFKQLRDKWKKDIIKERKFVIILDALNESSHSFHVFENVLELIETASEYPWCKVIISIREEFFSIWYGKLKDKYVNRTNPLYRLSRELGCLYYIPKLETNPLKKMEEDHPVLKLEPLTEETAKKVYENYQREVGKENSPKKACTSSWDELEETTKRILHNPLMLHLYNQTYGGKKGANLNNSARVYSAYIKALYEKKPALKGALSHIIECMISAGKSYLTKSDYDKIVNESSGEISPVELAVSEGLIRERPDYEGGGYNFIYQKVLEYVIYRYLRDEMKGKAPEDYWLIKVKEKIPFPEYGSSFSFFFRDLYESKNYSFIVRLVEEGVKEIGIALESFLEGHIREKETKDISKELQEFVRTASKEGWQKIWVIFNNIAWEFHQTGLSSISHLFCNSPIATKERLHKKDPENIVISNELAGNYGKLGYLLQNIGRKEEAIEYYEKAIEIRKPIYEKNPDNINISNGLASNYGNLGYLLQNIGRKEEAIEYYEKAIGILKPIYEKDPDNINISNGFATNYGNLGSLLINIGRKEEAIEYYKKAIEILKPLHEKAPENISISDGLATNYGNLGVLLKDIGRNEEAIEYYKKAIEIFKPLHEKDPGNILISRGLTSSYGNFGYLLQTIGQKEEAIEYYEKAIGILKPIYKKIPENILILDGLATNYGNLGLLLQSMGHSEEAIEYYEKAIGILKPIYEKAPKNIDISSGLAKKYGNLGSLLADISCKEEAIEYYEKAIGILKPIYEKNPDNIDISSGLANNYGHISSLLRTIGYKKEAVDYYEKAIGILKPIYEKNPDNIVISSGLASNYGNLGVLLHNIGRNEEAIEYYEKAIGIFKPIHEKNPANLLISNGLASNYGNLGVLLHNIGRKEEVIEYYKKAIRIRKPLYEKDPENIVISCGLACNYGNLGSVLQTIGCKKDAIDYYEKAIGILKPIYEKDPENIDISDGLATSYGIFGSLLANISCKEEAIEYYEKAIGIRKTLYEKDPENIDISDGLATNYGDVAYLLQNIGYKKEAIEYYEKAIAIRKTLYDRYPENIDISNRLAINYGDVAYLLQNIGYKKEATEYYEKAIAIRKTLYEKDHNNIVISNDLATNYVNLGLLLSDTERKEETKEYYEKAIVIRKPFYEKDPKNIKNSEGLAINYVNLGCFYFQEKDKENALYFVNEAITVSETAGLEKLVRRFKSFRNDNWRSEKTLD